MRKELCLCHYTEPTVFSISVYVIHDWLCSASPIRLFQGRKQKFVMPFTISMGIREYSGGRKQSCRECAGRMVIQLYCRPPGFTVKQPVKVPCWRSAVGIHCKFYRCVVYQQELKLIKPCAQIQDYCKVHPELTKKVTIVLRKPQEILTSRGGTAPNRKDIVEYGRDRCALPYKQMIARPDGKVSLCFNDTREVYTG